MLSFNDSDHSARHPGIPMLTILAEHWLSDVRFYHEEIKFLHRLTNQYVIWLTEQENIRLAGALGNRLHVTESLILGLEKYIKDHLHHARMLTQHPFSQDSNRFFEDHRLLESQLVNVMNLFRNLKREIFKLTETVIESEKVKLAGMK